MSDLITQLRNTPIAIIGLGAVMPEAHNLREFWNNIVNKVDCITDVPLSRWNVDDYYDPDPTAPDKTYSRRGGFIPEVDFDPLEFGLPPNILEVTDVGQMISLLVAKEALEDSGYLMGPEAIRDRTGVILGVGGGQKLITPLTSRLQYPVWDEVLQSYGIGDEDREKIIERMKLAYIRWEENSFPGMLGNVIAGRIANRFDLGGTNCVIDAACASTMGAFKMAVSELLEHRADMMVTGGVDVDNSIFMYMCFSKTPAFTKGTHPRPFDEASDGMMVGEGIGMMVLKRLEDAERDGDRIYAVIKGLGSSSDGRFKSIYAPRGEGQEKALRRAYEDAGFSPATLGLFEAHGTGTVAGDNTEITTAIRFLGQHDTKKQHIAIGSVKSQIGHTKASAGAAGLIKTALALHHKVLPPTRNVDTPNPKFDINNSAFYVSSETRPWIKAAEDTPRRAGVSSFGFGGTNFHVVMEEYTGDHKKSYRVHDVPQSVVISGGSTNDLRTKVSSLLDALKSEDAKHAFLNLVKETRTAQIPAGAARVGFVALDAKEAAEQLTTVIDMLASKPDAEAWTHPKGIFYRRSAINTAGKVVALFAGQGSQYIDMGKELALNFPEVRESFARIDLLLEREGKTTLSDVVFPRPSFTAEEKAASEKAIQGTDYAQPAIGALSAGMYKLLAKAGFKADFAAGHSFGEVSALWAAGVISDEDYYALVKARGAAMAPPANDPTFDAGTMLAVTGDVAAIEQEVAALAGVQVANRNSRSQVVVAGSKQAVAQAEAALKAKGYKTVALPVSAAFHTPLVGHAQKPFAQAIQAATFNAPKAAVYSNATGKPYAADPAAIKATLAEHILQPVYFRDEIENIYNAGGTIFVEFGPRNVLTNLVKDILADKPHVAIALNGSRQKDSDRQMREAFVQLQVLGLPLGSVDDYALEQDVKPKSGKKSMTVKLSGNNYVSEKTRATYQNALASGGTVTINRPAETSQVRASETLGTPEFPPVVVPQAGIAPAPTLPAAAPVAAAPSSDTESVTEQVDMNAVLSTLESTLAHFREHQRETQRVHEQFTQGQGEYFRIFFELTQQQAAVLPTLPANAADTLNQSMLRFHEYQSETLRMHEQFMRTQTDIAQSLLDVVRAQYGALGGVNIAPAAPRPAAAVAAPAPVKPAPVVQAAPVAPVQVAPVVEAPKPTPVAPVAAAPAPAPVQAAPAPAPVAAPAAPAVNTGELAALSAAMLRIVGDKTGYPAEMLELGMDMEADLGIDSIKRVEILGAMREDFPSLPQFSPEELGELRTLQQIVDYMAARAGGSAAPAAAPAAPAPVTAAPAPVAPVQAAPAPVAAAPVAAPMAVAPAVSGGADLAALSAAMLRIVGDKTGYPAEMLELGMDMEADLGIDSIKRVEILGAMREDFPSLPQFSPEELGELRTLQQIVDYMSARSGGTAAPAAAPVAAAVPASAEPVSNGHTNGVNGHATAAPAAASNGLQLAALSEAMLRIVGDKTGYPAEMLELGMDMEADLGIDSIKRVEILGAMREDFPSLPQFSPEELGELRTLQQIVDYMEEAGRRQTAPFDLSGAAAPAAASPSETVADIAPFDTRGIQRAEVSLRRLPVADALEYEVHGAVCLITDDGTPVTANVARALQAQGWTPVVLGMPALTSVASPAVQLADWSEAAIQAALASVESQFGSIGGYVQINPATGGAMFAEADKSRVKFAFLMAKHLKARLTHGNGTGRKLFITVTRLDGALGVLSGANGSAGGTITGGLFGLIKTLNLEWDGVFCRAIDIAPEADADMAARGIVAELRDPNRLITEVGYGMQGRVTLAARQTNGAN